MGIRQWGIVIPERGETNEGNLTFSLAFCLEAFLDHQTGKGPNQSSVVLLSWGENDWGVEGVEVAGICSEYSRETLGKFASCCWMLSHKGCWKKNKWEAFSWSNSHSLCQDEWHLSSNQPKESSQWALGRSVETQEGSCLSGKSKLDTPWQHLKNKTKINFKINWFTSNYLIEKWSTIFKKVKPDTQQHNIQNVQHIIKNVINIIETKNMTYYQEKKVSYFRKTQE